jgi:hypothetical protein
LSDLYSSAHKEEGLDLSTGTITVPSAGISIDSRAFAGERWFILTQKGSSPAQEDETIAVSYGEAQELVSGLQELLERYAFDNAPEQLRLFDPDAEDPSPSAQQ